MNKQQRNSRSPSDSPAGVGVITILMVLSVLCLSTFAALTFFSAKADMRLSQVLSTGTTEYYEADRQATIAVGEFLTGNETMFSQTFSISDYQDLVVEAEKTATGTLNILSWKVVALEDTEFELPPLPVWGGTK